MNCSVLLSLYSLQRRKRGSSRSKEGQRSSRGQEVGREDPTRGKGKEIQLGSKRRTSLTFTAHIPHINSIEFTKYIYIPQHFMLYLLYFTTQPKSPVEVGRGSHRDPQGVPGGSTASQDGKQPSSTRAETTQKWSMQFRHRNKGLFQLILFIHVHV